MKRRSKVCLIILSVLVIIYACITFTLDIVAKKIINQQLAQRLETEASVGKIEISLLRGKVTIKNLVIKEPLEEDTENLIAIGSLSVDISLRSLFSDMIYIQSVTFKDTYINVVSPIKNVYNFMAVIPNGTNMMNVAVEDVAEIVTNEIYVVEEEIVKVPKPILLKKISVDNLNITYKDYNLSEPPVFVDLRNIDVNVKDLLLNGEPDGELLSKIDCTCEIIQKKNSGYFGVWAEAGNIGSEGKIPAVNAVIAITGLDLESYEEFIPTGLATSLGGSILDIRVDVSLEQEYLFVKASLMTVSGKVDITVDGTPDNPSMSMRNILTSLGLRGIMSLANPVVNVGDAGLKAGGATVNTGVAIVAGAGNALGNIGKGLFNTVKSTAKGEFKEAGSHFLRTGTDTVGDVFITVTNTAGTAAGGAVDSGGALMNKNSMEKWQTGVETRKDAVWLKAPEDLKKMSYPKK